MDRGPEQGAQDEADAGPGILKAVVGSVARRDSAFSCATWRLQGFPLSVVSGRGHRVENPGLPNLPKALRS